MSLPWFLKLSNAHLLSSQLLHVITYWLADSATPTQYARVTRLSRFRFGCVAVINITGPHSNTDDERFFFSQITLTKTKHPYWISLTFAVCRDSWGRNLELGPDRNPHEKNSEGGVAGRHAASKAPVWKRHQVVCGVSKICLYCALQVRCQQLIQE